eukprot:TRINITY_DN4811_c0_g1_i1.p1 TRINITY_DN4811_c0_g1~~TRINITY_DN4811_c0_g1_i1.p1  ORF type:complete len:217 (+),score=50.48 TRINITY_DN4811_c0_g1_i1:72-722(+)
MDLLDSILTSINKTTEVRKIAQIKEATEQKQKKKQHELEKLKQKQWRMDVVRKLNEYVATDTETPIHFAPMTKIYRLIVHEVAERNALVSHSFGLDENDRITVVYKSTFAPTVEDYKKMSEFYVEGMPPKEMESMLKKLKNGEEIQPSANNQDALDNYNAGDKARVEQVYRNKKKYKKLETADPGFIILNTKKRDRRSIEEIQSELQQKTKRQKLK